MACVDPADTLRHPGGAMIEAVAMDLSGAYPAAARAHLPRAGIVSDHLHAIDRSYHDPSRIRRDLDRKATDVHHREVLEAKSGPLRACPESPRSGLRAAFWDGLLPLLEQALRSVSSPAWLAKR
jgi:hypothetical protein